MSYEKRDNSGVLFKNDRKAATSHADYNGSITVNGVDYWLNAWVKEGQKGKFFSLSVKPKEQAKPIPRNDRITSGPQQRRSADMDDEIPFLMEWR